MARPDNRIIKTKPDPGTLEIGEVVNGRAQLRVQKYVGLLQGIEGLAVAALAATAAGEPSGCQKILRTCFMSAPIDTPASLRSLLVTYARAHNPSHSRFRNQSGKSRIAQ